MLREVLRLTWVYQMTFQFMFLIARIFREKSNDWS